MSCSRRDIRDETYRTIRAVLAWSLCVACSPGWAGELIDPTRPASALRAVATVRSAAPPRVSAIFLSAERRVAVFDGRVVKAGDRIGDVLIEAVLVDGVRYRRGATVEYARLPKQTVSVRRSANFEESEP